MPIINPSSGNEEGFLFMVNSIAGSFGDLCAAHEGKNS